MARMYQCLDCGALMNGFGPEGVRTSEVIAAIGCGMCGSKRYKPLIDQLPPEKEEDNNEQVA